MKTFIEWMENINDPWMEEISKEVLSGTSEKVREKLSTLIKNKIGTLSTMKQRMPPENFKILAQSTIDMFEEMAQQIEDNFDEIAEYYPGWTSKELAEYVEKLRILSSLVNK